MESIISDFFAFPFIIFFGKTVGRYLDIFRRMSRKKKTLYYFPTLFSCFIIDGFWALIYYAQYCLVILKFCKNSGISLSLSYFFTRNEICLMCSLFERINFISSPKLYETHTEIILTIRSSTSRKSWGKWTKKAE